MVFDLVENFSFSAHAWYSGNMSVTACVFFVLKWRGHIFVCVGQHTGSEAGPKDELRRPTGTEHSQNENFSKTP